jgi:lycopene cyclase domain-containing protein
MVKRKENRVIYYDIALSAVFSAVVLDLFLLKSRMMTRGIFWLTYFLILPFQLLTNWWLTSNGIVMYTDTEIIGQRLAGAPIEDLLFGFSMILLTLSAWEFFKKLNYKQSA